MTCVSDKWLIEVMSENREIFLFKINALFWKHLMTNIWVLLFPVDSLSRKRIIFRSVKITKISTFWNCDMLDKLTKWWTDSVRFFRFLIHRTFTGQKTNVETELDHLWDFLSIQAFEKCWRTSGRGTFVIVLLPHVFWHFLFVLIVQCLTFNLTWFTETLSDNWVTNPCLLYIDV